MALHKKAKIWLAVLITPVVLLIACTIGLKIYLTGDRLKALIIPRIEETINRQVAIKDVSFSVFPPFTVSIDSLAVSNPEIFARAKYVSLANLSLRVNIFSLLKNKMDIGYMIIDHPVINMEVLGDGTNNYSLVGKEPGGEPAGGGLGAGLAFFLPNLEIKDGEFEFINRKSGFRLLISGLNQSSEIAMEANSGLFKIQGESSIGKISYGTLSAWLLTDQPVSATLLLTYNVDKDVLSFDAVNAKLKELPLSVTGTISRLRQEKMSFDLSVTTPGTGMNQLLSLVPADFLRAANGITSSGNIKFATAIKGILGNEQTPGVNGSFTLSDGNIRYGGLPKSITGINIAGSFERPEVLAGEKPVGNFALEKFSASLGDNHLSGNLKITNFDDPSVSGSFSGTLVLGEIKEFYPLEKGTELSGIMTADIKISGKARVPQSLTANGQINFKEVTIKSAGSPKPLQNLTGTITFNNQMIESKQISMNIGESDLNLSFAVKNYLSFMMAGISAARPSASIALKSKQLRTIDLISGPPPDQNQVGGKQAEKTRALFLPGVDIDATVEIGRLATEKFEFNNARGSLSIVDNIINLKNFTVNAFQGNVATRGTLDLRNMNKKPFDLDLSITGVEANSALAKFTSFGKNISGKFNMSTKIKGDMDDTLGINIKTLLGDGRAQITDGKLTGFPLTTKLAEFTNIEDLRQVSFKNWTNAFSISDGNLQIKDLRINGSASDFLVNGTHGLDGTMLYSLNLKLPSSVSDRLKLSGVPGQLVQFFKDKDGRISLDFNITGTTTSPSLRLNTKAQEDMAKQVLEQAKQKLLDGEKKIGDDLKKKAEESLKKLFKKP